ncbi:MAG TPA: ABC transporter permease [Bryobacteraceae bacterium]|jgi:predicted permease|nr:ABC transporter permease [Bryobacteraceae bacterium]
MIPAWLSRLLATLRPRAHERRLQDEIASHLDALAAREASRGIGSEEARDRARRAFGSIESAKERYRDQARFRALENAVRDIRFALRQYRKSPAFTIAAVVSLALGIGANAALFSFVNAILLKHLPVPQPERLHVLRSSSGMVGLAYAEIERFRRDGAQLGTFLGSFPMDVSFSLGQQPEWVPAELVTGDYFRTLQIQAERGRLLDQRDLDAAAGNPVCVISDRLWQTRLGGAPDAIGRTILINTRPYTIVGIAARGFRGTDLLRPSDIQIPITRLSDFMPSFASDSRFDWRSRLFFLSTIVRLNSSVSASEAQALLTRLQRGWLQEKKLDPHETILLAAGAGGFSSHENMGKPVSILLGVSLVVLLIACANLATLLLSRTSARAHEFTLRLAIGGSRGRIFGQVLIESTLLAVFGTIAGILAAYGIAQVLLAFLNRTTPAIHQLHIGIDSEVLGFVAIIAGLSVLLFGTAPALQAARAASPGSSSAGNTRAGAGLRRTFVVAQIALSFLVVLSAGLFAETLRHLSTLELGYVPDEISAIDIRPASGGYAGERASRFYKQLVDRLRSTPGVRAAATALGPHIEGGVKMTIQAQSGERKYQANLLAVSPGYLETFGARILAGRDFDPADRSKDEGGFIVSEHLARSYFHGRQAAGNYLLLDGRKIPVVGVVSNIRDANLRDGSLDTVYQNVDKLLTSSLTVYVRCAGSCRPLLPTIRKTIHDFDPSTPILSLVTMKTEIEGTFSTEQALGFLSMLFGGLALILVAAGLYGVLSYSLTRRTREIGIRTAIGALPADIIRLFASEALIMLALGTLIGVPCSLAAVNLLRSQLFGVTPHDPGALLVCSGCIAATVILSSIAPIRRALTIAPQQALRVD